MLALFLLAQVASAKTNAALDAVEAEYKKYGQHVSGLKRECVSFEVEKSTKTETTVIEREVHNKACEGDPSTSPKVATFVVRGKRVMIEDPTSGKLVLFNENFRSDGP